DGTNLGLALDPAVVTALTDAVSAVNLFPAGDPALTCSTSSASGAKNGANDFVVGGGQAENLGLFGGTTQTPCLYNFSVSGHAKNGAAATAGQAQPSAGGTFNVTATQTKCMFSGHLVSKVDCVAVDVLDTNNLPIPGSAQITAQVTHVDGGAFSPQLLGEDIEVDLYDSGIPGG